MIKAKQMAFVETFGPILKKVDVNNDEECWDWQGGTDRGHIISYLNGKRSNVTRYIYDQWNNVNSGRITIRQLCGNPLCCNPHHLTAKKRAHKGLTFAEELEMKNTINKIGRRSDTLAVKQEKHAIYGKR